jgi:hypothetical protein
MIKQSARPWRIAPREHCRIVGHGAAEPPQKIGTAVHAGERVVGRNLKAPAQRLVAESDKRTGIHPQGIVALCESAGREHVEAGNRQPFRAADCLPGNRIAVAPRGAGAGIQQHARNREVEGGAPAGGDVAPACRLLDRRPAIVGADNKMPPARVKRNVERRIGLSRQRQHKIGGGFQLRQVEAKVLELAIESQRQHFFGALTHRLGAQERQDGGSGWLDGAIQGQNLSSARPLVFSSSSALVRSGV